MGTALTPYRKQENMFSCLSLYRQTVRFSQYRYWRSPQHCVPAFWENTGFCLSLLIALYLACAAAGAGAQSLPAFDFAATGGALDWTAAHDVGRLQPTRDGLRIEISGSDPYIIGPARDFPAGQTLWLTLRAKSDRGGDAQVFYFKDGPNEKDSVHVDCRPGVWEEFHVPLPALNPGTRFRFDPPSDMGSCLLARLAFEPRSQFAEPAWLGPEPPTPLDPNLVLQSGHLRLAVATAQWNDFVLSVDGHAMAIGHSRPLLGLVEKGQPVWIDIGKEVHSGRTVKTGQTIVSSLTLAEPGGAQWQIRQTYSTTPVEGAIDIKTEVSVDHDRSVLYLPMVVLLPGSGSFGTAKDHALLPGLEYLDENETSSSEADIIGAGAHRQTPDSMKSTIPLMVVQKEGRYVGLAWQPDAAFCALFDSPDRHLGSNGHALGILFPGSDGSNRAEGSLLPYAPVSLRAGQTLTLYATLLGGAGKSVVPAVQQFAALRGLPPPPRTGLNLQKYLDLAASGWLDSGIGDGGLYRHALPGAFKPQPAADAGAYMEWLADRTENDATAARLRAAARASMAQAAGTDLLFSGIGHVRYPLPALIQDRMSENADLARSSGYQLAQQFASDGSIPYRRTAGHPDLGRTHFAPDANGLTAQVVAALLDNASVCGDPELIRRGLQYLRGLDKFADSAPRGAQTWEVPLHTPDILASANLVRAYTLGYALSGDGHFLELARYWAWTGVPFVYLTPPLTAPARSESGATAQPQKSPQRDPIGVYSTIAVFGATQWTAPNWMGRPVQWCGLVYADALYRLLKYDPNPIWKTLADGITMSGIQQTWPRGNDTARQGLLPDSVSLRAQTRNDPGINPGTLEADAVQMLTSAPLYDLQSFHTNGLVLVHAPGRIKDAKDEPGHLVFTVEAWPRHPYDILVVGLKRLPRVLVDGKPFAIVPTQRFSAESGRLVLFLSGSPTVEILL